jgi:hypothetical protein
VQPEPESAEVLDGYGLLEALEDTLLILCRDPDAMILEDERGHSRASLARSAASGEDSSLRIT